MDKIVLTPAQEAAVRSWAAIHGRQWKSALHRAWGSHNYHGFEGQSELAWLRNAYGPRWLVAYRLNGKAVRS